LHGGGLMREPRLLVIEDDPDVQALLATVAKRRNVTVDRAGDGEEAIRMLETNQYDVVVLDLMLPKVNGFRVAEVVRQLDPKPRLILFSAISRYFADQFPEAVILQKPFDIGRVEDILAGKAQRD
jgi:DNA-binding response OmpR family regulator